jgi:hypothetical protein
MSSSGAVSSRRSESDGRYESTVIASRRGLPLEVSHLRADGAGSPSVELRRRRRQPAGNQWETALKPADDVLQRDSGYQVSARIERLRLGSSLAPQRGSVIDRGEYRAIRRVPLDSPESELLSAGRFTRGGGLTQDSRGLAAPAERSFVRQPPLRRATGALRVTRPLIRLARERAQLPPRQPIQRHAVAC